MPANIVKPGQEAQWSKAKRLAAKQGRAEDWPYVVGIFQRMTGQAKSETGALVFDAKIVSIDDLAKAEFPLGAHVGGAPVRGQAAVVIRELRANQAAALRGLDRLTGGKAPPWSTARFVAETGRAVKSADDVVDGLGLSRDARRAVVEAVDEQAKAPLGYVQNARAAVIEACKSAGVESVARGVILRRSMALWGASDGRRMGKSELAKGWHPPPKGAPKRPVALRHQIELDRIHEKMATRRGGGEGSRGGRVVGHDSRGNAIYARKMSPSKVHATVGEANADALRRQKAGHEDIKITRAKAGHLVTSRERENAATEKSLLPDETIHDGRARQAAQLRKAQDPGDMVLG